MSIFQSYLASPKIKRVLNRRPGEEGFSLIELVVVVAVLAVLATIAVPAFLGLADDGEVNAAKTALANVYKECAYQSARGVVPPLHTALADGGGVDYGASATTTACTGTATAAGNYGTAPWTLTLDLATGAKSTTGTCSTTANQCNW